MKTPHGERKLSFIHYSRACVQNADLGCIPNFEHNDAMYHCTLYKDPWPTGHNDAMYLEKSEQLQYNVEDRDRVEGRYKVFM